MWRSACLGSRGDQLQILLLTLTVAAVTGLVAADKLRWWAGPPAAAVPVLLVGLLYLWRRRVWDARVRREADAGVAQLEVMLQGHRHRREG